MRTFPPNWLIVPHGVLAATIVLSFAAWSVPDFDIFRKGFAVAEPLFSEGGLIVAAWYVMLYAVAWIGFQGGRSFHVFPNTLTDVVSIDGTAARLFLRSCAFVGIAYTWSTVGMRLGAPGIAEAFSNAQGNEIKVALYESYSIGLASLRYSSILIGALALRSIYVTQKIRLGDAGDLSLLLLSAVIGSRLSLIAALLICLAIIPAGTTRDLRQRLPLIITTSACVLLALTIMNAVRNSRFYESLGLDNPLIASVAEILTYLGAPFQGALSAGNEYSQIVKQGIDALHPSVEESLTTNSALLELLTNYGNAAWLIAGGTVLFASWLMGTLFSQRSSALGLLYGVLLFCFAEMWRLFLFEKGIVITIIVLSLVATCVQALFSGQRVSVDLSKAGN
jgi:hypothetical protein